MWFGFGSGKLVDTHDDSRLAKVKDGLVEGFRSKRSKGRMIAEVTPGVDQYLQPAPVYRATLRPH